MISVMERRLAEFVDRVTELRRFGEMLDSRQKPIMFVSGDAGIGKTSLKFCMLKECVRRKLRKTEVVWTDTRNHDYVAVMRKIRDDVGGDTFNGFTDLVNHVTVPSYNLRIEPGTEISVANQAKFRTTTVGDIAAVIIKDSMFVVPRSDLNLSEGDRRSRLTDQFIQDLAATLESEPLVVFLDSIEKMTRDTKKWLWGDLLQAVADQRLDNIWFVLLGRKQIEFDTDLRIIVEETKLKPLERTDIIEYLAKRGFDEARRADIADTLFVSTDGNPRKIATYVDALMQMWEDWKHSSG